ncbi:MAG TPA: lactate utilization protein [Clostridia bacterium]|nr:lactate utilization protein [Clostridia bacterium]
MDNYVNEVLKQKIDRTIKNLEKNNMKGYYAKNVEALHDLLATLIEEGSTIGLGGSMTLFETKALDFIREGNYELLDRYAEGLDAEAIKKIYRESFFADTYLMSTNAITEAGELYNVDGRGNRVAALIYGPDQVIVIAGANKIVNNLDEAISRNESIAAPANTKRLGLNNPCKEVGYCVDCSSETRICNNYTFIKNSLEKDRIHVIFLNENFGY